ncbi:MAG: hypothetical protein BSR46_17575 [Candidatus Dactylopiibacterium carminicum]|nr:MAG: hypothetical protein BSR46_17575 [Candidatus Dactylopiibacterium carminicum]
MGQVVHRYPSNHLSLGVDSLVAGAISITELHWPQMGGQLLLSSDGVIEAVSDDGRTFGYEGVIGALAGSHPRERLAVLQQALRRHLDAQAGHDDISMLLLDLPG